MKRLKTPKKVILICIILITTISLLLISRNITNKSWWKDNLSECKQSNYHYEQHETKYSEKDCKFSAAPNGVNIKELDKVSCRRISQFFIADQDRVYKQLYDPGSSNYPRYIIIKEAEPSLFNAIGGNFYTDQRHIYYDNGNNYKIVNDFDLGTVKVLSHHFIKDKNGIYYAEYSDRGDVVKKLVGFDTQTFEVLQNDANHETYFMDKNGVYFDSSQGKVYGNLEKIQNADIKSFQVLDYYQLAKDKKQVYYNGGAIEVSDPDTFEVIGDGYFKDNTSVYSRSYETIKLLPNLDGCTFELIDYENIYSWKGYSRDKNHTYYRGKIVE